MHDYEDRLRAWLTKQVAHPTGQGVVTKLELWWSMPGHESALIATVELAAEGAAVQDIVTGLVDAAENDAMTRAEGIPQAYAVGVFRDDPHAPCGQHRFLVTAQRSDGHFSMKAVEASPEEVGKMAVNQQIRHTETLHRMLIEQTHHTSGYLASELDKERKARAKAEENVMNLFIASQDLEDRKLERELERARAQAAERRHNEMMGLIMTAAPILLAQFTGGLGMKGAPVARDAGIKAFLKNLNESEIAGVVGSLRAENQMALMELYKSYQAEGQKEEKELHPLLRESGEEKVH